MTERHRPEALYEAPRVERVLSPEELERELQYAGDDLVSVDNDGDGEA